MISCALDGANETDHPDVRVFGVGRRGISVIERMSRTNPRGRGRSFVRVDPVIRPGFLSHEMAHLQLCGNRKRKAVGLCDVVPPDCNHEEDLEAILNSVKDADMVVLIPDPGCSTTIAVARAIAEQARRLGILTVALVALPFYLEGRKRVQIARNGLKRILADADSTVVIDPNSLLGSRHPWRGHLREALPCLEYCLLLGVRALTDVIAFSGSGADFADIKTVLTSSGLATMGLAETNNPNVDRRVAELTWMAFSSNILSEKYSTAKSCLLWLCGATDPSDRELVAACNVVEQHLNRTTNIILAKTADANLAPGVLQCGVVLAGISG